MAQAAAKHMKPDSAIINTGFVTGIEGSKQLIDYSMTKGGIHAFTRALSGNLLAKGIRVNCVAPGPVWTPLNPSDKEAENVSQFGAQTPLKKAGATRRDCASLCIPRIAALLQLHHRRDSPDHRWLLIDRARVIGSVRRAF
jgi:NAD(P)-dependent dehydrogenase (short-subunit alcohol dehydrogenase family)